MKKSEIYTLAMVAVVNSRDFGAMDKLDIIETLLSDKSIALYREKLDAEAAEKAKEENA